jgi:hypothetical protein
MLKDITLPYVFKKKKLDIEPVSSHQATQRGLNKKK